MGRGAALSAATGRDQFWAREVSAVVTVPSLDVASVLNSERKTQAIRIVVLFLAFFWKDDQGWGLQLCLKAKQKERPWWHGGQEST